MQNKKLIILSLFSLSLLLSACSNKHEEVSISSADFGESEAEFIIESTDKFAIDEDIEK